MKIIKKIARKFVFPAVTFLGLEKSFRITSRHSVLNIMYHGVVPQPNSSFSPRHISTAQFEKHLKYFLNNFTILSLPEAFDHYRNKSKLNQKAITISFDDGYKNNLDFALPILERYNIKTTFFISGICVDEPEIMTLWTDLIACLLYFHKNEVIEIENFRFVNGFDNSVKVRLSDYIKSLQPIDRERVTGILINKYNLKDKLKQIPSQYWEIMNRADIQKLAASGIAKIGSHGYSHYNLGNIGEKDASEELKKSKYLLENISNGSVDMIAYPDGSYTPKIKDLATALGYDKQLAVDYQYNEDLDDPRILNRYGLSGTTTFESNIFFLNKSFNSKGYN